MQSPLTKLEQAVVTRAYHTADQDSLRVEFHANMVLIVYNDITVDTTKLSIADPSCELPTVVGLRVETITSTDKELAFQLSAGRCIRIALIDQECHGPEAFQLVLPGYPLIVEQNQ